MNSGQRFTQETNSHNLIQQNVCFKVEMTALKVELSIIYFLNAKAGWRLFILRLIKYNIKIKKMSNQSLTVDSIIKKYEKRQEELVQSLAIYPSDSADTSRSQTSNLKSIRSGQETPQFSSTNRKDQPIFKENLILRTHKKNEGYQTFNPVEVTSSPFPTYSTSHQNYQKLLARLDQTEKKLFRSERNCAQAQRKYQMLIRQGKKAQKQIEIEQKLKGKESAQLMARIASLERENKNFKECLGAKDSNLSALREKLKEKNERMVQTQRVNQTLKSELQLLRAQHSKIEEDQNKYQNHNLSIVSNLKEQLNKFQNLLQQKEKEKKELLLELQKNYIFHKEELEVLRLSYSKVEEEYKEWIQDCKQEKLSLIKQYEQKLKQNKKIGGSSCKKFVPLNQIEADSKRLKQQIEQLNINNKKLSLALKNTKSELQKSNRIKQDLIFKISGLENTMIQKLEQQQAQQNKISKLQALLDEELTKNKEISLKNNEISIQFQEIKSKCSALFDEAEDQKTGKKSEQAQISKLKKEINSYKQQLEKSRSNELSLTAQLNDAATTLRKKSNKFDEEKQQIMTQLLAERLQTARLKEQLQETKVSLKREYELSIQNTKKQLQQQIQKYTAHNSPAGCDIEKQQLYLQMRELERRYQILASQIVSVDDMMGIAAKVQRRYQSKCK